ncbi:MAG TPA: hypothetical protein VLT36_07345 [Candidatus Dormibacteraeota bacterium]|nr:hypothetical protein [Candidatus Dormibacteraeota bacterium]
MHRHPCLCKHWFGLLVGCLVMPVMFGCSTNQTGTYAETVLPARVVRVSGDARLSMDNGKSWIVIRKADMLGPRSLIETAYSSELEIEIGPRRSAQHLLLCRTTKVWIDLISQQSSPAEGSLWHVNLELRTGTVMASVGDSSANSRYQVRLTNGIVTFGKGLYSVGAHGQVCVVHGKALVTLANGARTEEVLPGRAFFSDSGETVGMENYGIYNRPLLLE